MSFANTNAEALNYLMGKFCKREREHKHDFQQEILPNASGPGLQSRGGQGRKTQDPVGREAEGRLEED